MISPDVTLDAEDIHDRTYYSVFRPERTRNINRFSLCLAKTQYR